MADENLNGAVPPKATPGAPRPITVRLKPVDAKLDIKKVAEADEEKNNSPQPKETLGFSKPTARVVIPDFDDMANNQNADDSTSATVKLRPVKVPGASAGASPLKPVDLNKSHTPGSNPLPPGPKPPSQAQVQAAKSKTSRISLDAAIGVAPDGPMSGGGAPKTIRLKRPAKLAGTGKMPTSATAPLETAKAKSRTAPIGKTSRIPDEALLKDDSATVTQKKTLKIKRRGSVKAEGDFPAGVELTPIADLDYAPADSDNGALTVIAGIAAILAAVVVVMLTICLGAQVVGPAAGKNNLATIKLGGMELPWPGRITE